MAWQRIISLLAGLAPVVYDQLDHPGVPGWLSVIGAGIFFTAVNAEKYMAKREKGATAHDLDAQQDKLDKLDPPL